MKNLLLLCAIVLSSAVLGQGNLQFNRVINQKIIQTANMAAFGSITQTVTIPSGKIWKIESAAVSPIFPTGGYLGQTYNCFTLKLDSWTLYTKLCSGAVRDPINFPIWLPAGTYTLRLYNDQNSLSNTFQEGMLSIIEFNIIP